MTSTMQRRRVRFTTARMMLAVAAFGLFLGGIRLLHDGYYEDRIRISNELGTVKGITGIEVMGSDDITFEVHCARFEIAGRPDAVIEIEAPGAGLVGRPQHLLLRRLGPWEFHQVSHGHQGVFEIKTGKPVASFATRSSIDLGSLGEYGAMLPVKVRDVNDIVAHYDELVRYFATWPDEKRWGILDMPSGTRLAYCCMTNPRRGPIPPPPQFPKAW